MVHLCVRTKAEGNTPAECSGSELCKPGILSEFVGDGADRLTTESGEIEVH
jgi:hypothetical protein